MTKNRMFLVLPLILALHILLLTNTKFTLWPEMVVYPYLINNGFNLYTDIINPYPPFFLGILTSFTRVFGYQPTAYQILTWSTVLITDLVVYLTSKKLFGRTQALISTAFFIVLSIPFGANGLWFDLIQTPLIVMSAYFFYQFLKTPKNFKQLFFSIFFLTIAFFIKQQVIWLISIYAYFIFLKKIKLKYAHIIALAVPFLFLLLFQILAFSIKGTLMPYLYWTFYFPFIKASSMPGYVLLPTLRQITSVVSLLILFLPTLLSKETNKLIPAQAFALVLFAYPRFDYFHLIPALGILAIIFGQNLQAFFKTTFLAKTLCLLAIVLLFVQTSRYLINNWTKEIRFFESDIYRTADFLKRATTQDQKIYIQNGPDQLLPLSGRLPTKPWADEFPWYLETPSLQDKVVQGMVAQRPIFVISKPYDQGETFEIGTYRPTQIDSYIEENYQNFFQISATLWLKIKK